MDITATYLLIALLLGAIAFYLLNRQPSTQSTDPRIYKKRTKLLWVVLAITLFALARVCIQNITGYTLTGIMPSLCTLLIPKWAVDYVFLTKESSLGVDTPSHRNRVHKLLYIALLLATTTANGMLSFFTQNP